MKRDAREATVGGLLQLRDHPLSEVAVRIVDCHLEAQEPDVAFIIPVHDQGPVIYDHLESVRQSGTGRAEFVIIIDGCEDHTLDEVLRWLRHCESAGGPSRIVIAETGEDVFETVADCIGVALSSAPYLLEIQADMQIVDPGFDRLLVDILRTHTDLFAVGGRGIHPSVAASRSIAARWRRAAFQGATRALLRLPSWRLRSLAARWLFLATGCAGRLGELIEQQALATSPRWLFVGDTVMRGPVAMRRHDYSSLGGFDCQRFFLGDDEHDLNDRARRMLGKKCAYYPIRFLSPLSLGSTRRPRTAIQQRRFEELRDHCMLRQAASAGEAPAFGTVTRELRSYRRMDAN